jgi:hypothetical protein
MQWFSWQVYLVKSKGFWRENTVLYHWMESRSTNCSDIKSWSIKPFVSLSHNTLPIDSNIKTPQVKYIDPGNSPSWKFKGVLLVLLVVCWEKLHNCTGSFTQHVFKAYGSCFIYFISAKM